MYIILNHFGIKFDGVHPEINTKKMINRILDVAFPIIYGLIFYGCAKNCLREIHKIDPLHISQKITRIIPFIAGAVGILLGFAVSKLLRLCNSNQPVPQNIQANVNRLHLTRIQGDIFSTESGYELNMRNFILNMVNSYSQAREDINLSGIAHYQGTRVIICKTPQDLEDLIAIGRELFPNETAQLEITVEQLRNIKAELSNKFPTEIIDIFSMLSTIMNQNNFRAFGDIDRDHAEVRQDAMLYAKDALEKYTLLNGKPTKAGACLANYCADNITITQCLKESLSRQLCINDLSPGYFAEMFPIGMHLISSEEDEKPRADEEKTRMFEILSGRYNHGKYNRHSNAR